MRISTKNDTVELRKVVAEVGSTDEAGCETGSTSLRGLVAEIGTTDDADRGQVPF
jgi:hypothetical protein